MSFNEDIWYGLFEQGHLPDYPCPTCRTGHIREVPDTFKAQDATYALRIEAQEVHPDDYIRKNFTMLTQCSNHTCGEIVSVMGSYSFEEAETDFGWGLEQVLNIRGMHPAPPMVHIPVDTPERVRQKLKNAFALFWVDHGACLNAVRTAGERMLDELAVPTTKRVKAKPATPTRPAKAAFTMDLDFNGRIQWLEKRNKNRAKILDALRKLGNLGSHGNPVKRSDTFSSLKLVEYLLRELYEKHVILIIADAIVKQPKPKAAKKKKAKRKT